MSDQILDKESWLDEALAVVNDIQNHVKHASVSTRLLSTNQKVYINLTTLENLDYCIEMSSSGLKVVGRLYDDDSLKTNMVYETPYAFLNSISPQYRHSFGGELMSKLVDLAKSLER